MRRALDFTKDRAKPIDYFVGGVVTGDGNDIIFFVFVFLFFNHTTVLRVRKLVTYAAYMTGMLLQRTTLNRTTRHSISGINFISLVR